MPIEKEQLSAILSRFQIGALNEMQERTITEAEGRSKVVLLSNTGSGKTLAFLLPLLARFTEPEFRTQAMIIVPTRELAVQIEQVFRQMGTGYKITACYGGHKREIEENNLVQAPKLIVGTPGRLGDHIRRGSIDIEYIESIVIDEFDKSLEYGYTDEMRFILESLPRVRNKMFTSATQAVDIPEYAQMEDAVVLNFLKEEEHEWDKVIYRRTISREEEKAEDLYKLLCDIGNRSTIIFCNHKETVERISVFLKERGIYNVFYHGSMEQRDRDAALSKFRNGSVDFLVTTDLASRGLDIANVRFIIHYQMPHTEDAFTHRNGRTARMDASGTIICMQSSAEEPRVYMDKNMEVMEIPGDAPVPEKPKWVTLYFPYGKKQKVNKIDIVGFLVKTGGLEKEDIGLIEVKDFHSFAAVRRTKATALVNRVKQERIKGKLAKIEVQK